MRPETLEFIRAIRASHITPSPIVDLGGCETNRQFDSVFLDDYEVWDRRSAGDVDKTIDITIPLPQWAVGYASTLICIDTLEHIFDLGVAVKNLGSIVKQGGLLIVAVPFAFPEHDSSGDYWRLTNQALERLFQNDFVRVDSGYYGDKVTLYSEQWVDHCWGTMQSSSYYLGRRK